MYKSTFFILSFSFFLLACEDKPKTQEFGVFKTENQTERSILSSNKQDWKLSKTYNQKDLSVWESKLQENKTLALLAIKNGEIDIEQYWNKGGVNQQVNTFSISHTVVSMLLACAMEENKIQNVFQTVGEFYPEFNQAEEGQFFNSKLEIRHLLSMSADLDWQDDFQTDHQFVNGLSQSDLEDYVLKIKVLKEPGSTFLYQSAASQLLALVIEKAVDMPIEDYASQKLWTPLGCQDEGSWLSDKENQANVYFGLFSTARDLGKLGQLYLQKGNWEGEQLIPEPFIDISIQSNGKSEDFGFNWWIYKDANHFAYYAKGYKGQYLIVVPKLDLVLIRFGEKDFENSNQFLKSILDQSSKWYN